MVSAVRCSGTDPQRPGTRLRIPSGERAVRYLRHQEDQNDAVPPSGKRPMRAFQPLHARSAAYAASRAEAQVACLSAGAGPGVQQHASRLDRLRTLLPALRTGAPTAGGRPAGTSCSHCSRGSRLGAATPPPPVGGPPQGLRPAEASCSQEGPLHVQGSRWPCAPGGRPRPSTQPRAGPPQNPGLLAARAASGDSKAIWQCVHDSATGWWPWACSKPQRHYAGHRPFCRRRRRSARSPSRAEARRHWLWVDTADSSSCCCCGASQ